MRPSKFVVIIGTLLLIAGALTDSVSAQRRGGGRRMFGQAANSEIGLLAIKEVRKHLQDEHGLSEESATALEKLAANAADETREEMGGMGGFRDMEDDEREMAMKEITEAIKEINTDAMKSAKKMLDKKQLKRLGELKIQQMGTSAFQDAVIQEMLGISDEQLEDINQVQEDAQANQREMFAEMRESGGGGDREAMMEKFQKLRGEAEKKTLAVLTEAQNKQLQKMRGEKFEFPQRQRQRRRRDRI